MDLVTVFRGMAFGGALMLVSGCASGSHAHSAQNICEAAGGKYSGNTCQPGVSAVSGRQICEKMEARWVEAAGVCEFEGGKK